MSSPFLGHVLAYVARASFLATILVLVVWGLRLLLRHHLSPHWRCALWLIVIFRLIWPFEWESPISLFNAILLPWKTASPGSWAWQFSHIVEVELDRWARSPIIISVWLTVAAVLFLRLLIGWVALRWTLRGAYPMDHWEAWHLLQDCKAKTRVTTSVTLYTARGAVTPCLVGVFRSRLFLPRHMFDHFSRDEVRDVMLHELAHHSRRDIALSWILDAICILHWFNPAVWAIAHWMREDREEACDELALRHLEPGKSRRYGSTLVKVLEVLGGPIPSLRKEDFLGRSEDSMIRRLRFILSFRPELRTWVVGCCTWLALALTGLTSAPRREPPPVIVQPADPGKGGESVPAPEVERADPYAAGRKKLNPFGEEIKAPPAP